MRRTRHMPGNRLQRINKSSLTDAGALSPAPAEPVRFAGSACRASLPHLTSPHLTPPHRARPAAPRRVRSRSRLLQPRTSRGSPPGRGGGQPRPCPRAQAGLPAGLQRRVPLGQHLQAALEEAHVPLLQELQPLRLRPARRRHLADTHCRRAAAASRAAPE